MYGDGRGKHIPGTTGCGCPKDPELGKGGSSSGGGGGSQRGHTHVYKTTRTQKGPVQTERQGLRRVKFRVTFYFEHCSEPGCPAPDRVVPQTEYL